MTFGATFGRAFSPTFHPKSQAVGGGFLPTDISGCLTWIDFSDANYLFTDAGVTKVSSDGQIIYQANDKSGNGKNAVRINASNNTLYKTNIKNGLSSALFGGSNDILRFTFAQDPPHSAFIVSYPTAASNAADIISHYSTNPWILRYSNSSTLVHSDGLSITATITLNNWHSVSAVSNGANSLLGVNSSETTGTLSAGRFYNLRINNAGGYRGYISEIILYNSALSDADMGKVETYLNNKWAIY